MVSVLDAYQETTMQDIWIVYISKHVSNTKPPLHVCWTNLHHLMNVGVRGDAILLFYQTEWWCWSTVISWGYRGSERERVCLCDLASAVATGFCRKMGNVLRNNRSSDAPPSCGDISDLHTNLPLQTLNLSLPTMHSAENGSLHTVTNASVWSGCGRFLWAVKPICSTAGIWCIQLHPQPFWKSAITD